MKRMRNVKIVATLGPASDDYSTIRALFESGVDIFRLNMSHGTHDDVRRRHGVIREVEIDLERPIGILADLQGPKIRCGTFANGSEELASGDRFRLDLNPKPGNTARVSMPHPEIFQALEPGVPVLINDGTIRLIVEKCASDFAVCRVEAAAQYPTARA